MVWIEVIYGLEIRDGDLFVIQRGGGGGAVDFYVKTKEGQWRVGNYLSIINLRQEWRTMGAGFGSAFRGGNEERHLHNCFLIHKRHVAIPHPKNSFPISFPPPFFFFFFHSSFY